MSGSALALYETTQALPLFAFSLSITVVGGSSAAGSTPQCHTLEFTGKGAGTTILIQFILFTVCVSTLLVKYWCEPQPRRPCCVWFWDVSKQGFGAAFMHLLNLILAGVLSESSAGDVADPCAWYFVNISIEAVSLRMQI